MVPCICNGLLEPLVHLPREDVARIAWDLEVVVVVLEDRQKNRGRVLEERQEASVLNLKEGKKGWLGVGVIALHHYDVLRGIPASH